MTIWFSIILFPYTALITPIIVYILFRSYYTYLTSFCETSISESNREVTGIVISYLYIISVLIWIFALVLLFVFNLRHDNWNDHDSHLITCGPFPD